MKFLSKKGGGVEKLIITVRQNEWMRRGPNPHVPYTPDEIAADAAACRAAGAAITHVHARTPDGGRSNSPELYAEIARKIREKSDILVHTTLGNIHNAGADEKRLAHVIEAKPDMASIDIGSNNTDVYVAAEKRFETTDQAYVNTIGSCLNFARTMKSINVKPLVACWSVPFLRAVDAFLDLGEFVEPVMVNLVLCEGGIIGGHRGTTDGLAAFFHALPANKRCAWTVCVKEGNILPVAALAIEKGGHISPGLGDYHYPELGYPTNAELVKFIADMARAMGREVATPEDARRILNMKN